MGFAGNAGSRGQTGCAQKGREKKAKFRPAPAGLFLFDIAERRGGNDKQFLTPREGGPQEGRPPLPRQASSRLAGAGLA
jgi:hypothetical protein